MQLLGHVRFGAYVPVWCVNVEGLTTCILGVNSIENPPAIFINETVGRLVRDAMYASRSGLSPYRLRAVDVRPASEEEVRFFDTVRTNSEPEHCPVRRIESGPAPRSVYLMRAAHRLHNILDVHMEAITEIFTPVVVTFSVRIQRSVVRGTITPYWNTSDRRIFMSLLRSCVDPAVLSNMNRDDAHIRRGIRRAYQTTNTDYYTASRFLASVERFTLARDEEEPHPDGLTVQLRPYQLRTLAFCLKRERSSENLLKWQRIRENLYWSSVTQRFSNCCDATVRGGFVFEEMGMGKTVEMLSLHLSNPPEEDWEDCGTLVVCPVALVSQWEEEAKRCLEDPGVILVHHGPRRHRHNNSIAQASIVLTTYGVLSRSGCILRDFKWHRVIFDESHVARRSTTMRWKACINVDARFRWAVTGTPLVNGTLQELYCQTRIVSPDIQIASSSMHWGNSGFLFLLSKIASRFSKSMRINGQPILELPDLDRQTVRFDLSEGRQRSYDAAEAEMRVNAMSGPRTRLFTAVDRMRRRCSSWNESSHYLSGVDEARMYVTGEEDIALVEKRMQEDNCAICLESIEQPGFVRGCKHVFCYRCIRSSVQHGNHQCPLCRGSVRDILTLRPPQAEEKDDSPEEEPQRDVKLTFVTEEILRAPADDKFVIFSNYKSTLHALSSAFGESGIPFLTLAGTLSVRQRSGIMKRFSEDPSIRALLLPIRNTAVGLNIIAANRVILMEPCLAPAMERQAIGRCWRMGQTRPVKVHRLVLNNTLEEKIMRNHMVGSDVHGSERVIQSDRDRVRWNHSRLFWLLGGRA